MSHKLELLYTDANGNPVRTELGPGYVHVFSSAFDSAVSTDKPEYQANENAAIAVTLTNMSEYARTIDAKMVIEDGQGVAVQEVGALQGLSFSAGETKSLGTLPFNTGSNYAGTYRAHLVLSENQTQIGEAIAQFTIQPTIAASSKITTDKLSYSANETASITSTVTSMSPNYAFENLTARVSIRNTVDGRQIYSETKAINTLMPGAVLAFKSYCPAATDRAGSYSANLEVVAGQTVLAASSAGFEVLSSSRTGAGLSGTIAATVDPVYQGREETFNVSVANNGTDDLTGLTVNVIVADPETGEAKAEVRREESGVRRGETITDVLTASTANLPPKTYLAILQIRTPEMAAAKTLASKTFEVKPGIEATKRIPDIKNVLVWVNERCREDEREASGVRREEGDGGRKSVEDEDRKQTTEAGDTQKPSSHLFAKSPSRPPLTKGDAGGFGPDGKDTDHGGKDDDGNDDVDDGHQRACIRLDLLEDALGQAATGYHIVYDKKDFQAELRNPYYSDFLILGDHASPRGPL